MSHLIESSTLRILDTKGKTVGTGFLVAPNLVVTCAHVIAATGLDGNERVSVQWGGQNGQITTAVLLDEDKNLTKDIAVLQVDEIPPGAFPLTFGPSIQLRRPCPFESFGYATAASRQGIIANGTIDGYILAHQLLQLQSPQADHGLSGAPVLDENRKVVGIITEGQTELGRNQFTTFAIPSEIIWQVCPQLKPVFTRHPLVEGIHLLPYDYSQRIESFLAEYLGSGTHPVPFGGRDQALTTINTWLEKPNGEPYLLLAAPAGRGKSALLTRWLDELGDNPTLALAFVPVSVRFGTNLERVFYAALAARLAFLYGDDVPASPETSTEVYRGLVSRYLGQPLPNGRSLLVVLDGLDEAADWQAGADFMPASLPAGVRVAVSARFLAGDGDSSTPWLARLNWKRPGLAIAPFLTPLDRAGVADVLLKMDCPLDELSRDVDIVYELHRLSAGDPLLVRLYVDDLWVKGNEVTPLKPKGLSSIEPGYKGFFNRWWEDQEKLWGSDEPMMRPHVQILLNFLACALAGLTRDELVKLSDQALNRYTLDNAFKVLKRFIIGDGIHQGYTYSHPKLGQYFWDALTAAEQKQIEKQFLDWGEQTLQALVTGQCDPTKKDQIPAYLVTNYTAHLLRAKQPLEKFLPLVQHQQWAQAWFTLDSSYGGYAHDVQCVWEQCLRLDRQAIQTGEKAPLLGQQIRCALIKASLHSLAGNIPIELIPVLVRQGIWTLPQTWVFIREMPEAKQQADAIVAMIPDLDDQQILEALAVAQAIKVARYRASALSALAQRLPGAAGEALEAARAIQDEGDRALVLSALAQRLPENELGLVLEAAYAIQAEGKRALVLSALAQRLPEIELGPVLEAARAIQDEGDRASVLSALAQRLPEVAGEALEAARAIQAEGSRARVLSTLAQRLPEVAEEALEAARAIQAEGPRALVLSDLSQRLPENELGRVLEGARAIHDEGRRALVLSALAQRLPEIELGLVQEAVRAIQDEGRRALVLSALAQRLPKLAGDALEAARAIQDEGSRTLVLSALAQRLPELTGDALGAARAIQDEGRRALVLSALAQRLPENELGLVLEAAYAIQDEGKRALVLSALAQRLPENELGPVLEAARAIQDEGDRARVLSDLAQRLPENELGLVLEAARAIQAEGSRALVLSGLAQRLPENELGLVLEAAHAIQAEGSRALVLSDLAQHLPENELGLVLEAARAIQAEGSRALVLSALAQRLPEVAGEALEAARAIQAEGSRARMLSALAQRLPEVAGEALEAARAIQAEGPRARVLSDLAQRLPENALGLVLEAARAIQAEGRRALVLSDLAQRLPELAGEALEAAHAIQDEGDRARVLSDLAQRLPENELGLVLEAARAIQAEGKRALVLSALAQRLPENELGPVLEAARAIQAKGDRARVLSDLAQPLSQISRLVCYPLIEPTLSELALRNRKDLFLDISDLLPVFLHLGAKEMEIFEAVQDVSRWWK